MPNNPNFKPKSGDYFTSDDVLQPVLPASAQKNLPAAEKVIDTPVPLPPMNKKTEELWKKQIARIAAGNGSSLGTPPPAPPPLMPPKPRNSLYPSLQTVKNPSEPSSISQETPAESDTENEDTGRHLPPYLRYLLSPTLKRAKGNPSWVWTVKVTTEKNGKVARKFQEFHLIVCWYQFIIGALGGIAVGLETGFFTAARLAEPNIPLPDRPGFLRKMANFAVTKSSSAYRMSKRAVISGYLFDVIDKNVEEHRQKQDWKNMGISGGITGAVFGLRGGFRGSLAGSLLFAGFGSLAGYQFYRIKQGKSKPGS